MCFAINCGGINWLAKVFVGQQLAHVIKQTTLTAEKEMKKVTFSGTLKFADTRPESSERIVT